MPEIEVRDGEDVISDVKTERLLGGVSCEKAERNVRTGNKLKSR